MFIDALETINVPDTNTDDLKKNQTTTLPKKAWNESDDKLTSDPTGQTEMSGQCLGFSVQQWNGFFSRLKSIVSPACVKALNISRVFRAFF